MKTSHLCVARSVSMGRCFSCACASRRVTIVSLASAAFSRLRSSFWMPPKRCSGFPRQLFGVAVFCSLNFSTTVTFHRTTTSDDSSSRSATTSTSYNTTSQSVGRVSVNGPRHRFDSHACHCGTRSALTNATSRSLFSPTGISGFGAGS